MMEALWQDIRYAVRILVKSPGFTAIAVLILALGIGANTAIFSVVYATLLRPLPYREPERLFTLAESRGQKDWASRNASYPDYLDWTRAAKSFDALAAYGIAEFTFFGGTSPETIRAARVTSNFFATLGVKPELGRDFISGEDLPNGAPVAILSDRFWRERFAAGPSVIGQAVRLGSGSVTIVGVLPKGFEFAPADSPALWVPLQPPADLVTRRNLRWLHVIGRIKHGVAAGQAFAEMQAINAGLAAAYPQANGAIRVVMGSLREQIVGKIQPLLLTLLGAVGFVLLIACANIVGLLLARGVGRRKEIAVRMALGVGRRALVRQFLAESLTLALVGGGLGLLWSQWGVGLMVATIPKDQFAAMPYLDSVQINPAVLAFTSLVVLATGVLFGLVPAIQTSRTDANLVLKSEGRIGQGQGTSRLRNVLVAAEIGLAVVLLTGAGLMVKSVDVLLHQDPGFSPQNLLTFGIDLPSDAYREDQSIIQFEHRFSEHLRSLPGVLGVATVSKLPLTGDGNTIRFIIEGQLPAIQGSEDESNIRTVTAGYFDVMRIPLAKGRFFGWTDVAGVSQRMIINRAFAMRFFPGEDPVGKRIRFTFSATQPFRDIVGVVDNENAGQLDGPMSPILYTPFDQGPDNYLNYVMRTSGNPEDQLHSVRELLRSVDPELPLIDPQTMVRIIAESPAVFLRRYPSYLISSFAGLAILLAMVGLYGLISFTVARRTHEIGLRMAIGARRADVLRLVVRKGLELALIGVGAGLAAAAVLTRLMSGLLFGVKPTDPTTFVGISLLVVLVAFLACYIPARRAMSIDPMVALRHE